MRSLESYQREREALSDALALNLVEQGETTDPARVAELGRRIDAIAERLESLPGRAP